MSILEPVLARWRHRVASGLIPGTHRAGRLLDVGCGVEARFLKHRFKEMTYTRLVGLDAREPRGMTGYSFVRAEAPPLPFERKSFDVAVLIASLEHRHKSVGEVLLTEVRRVLAPGGVCILTTPSILGQALLVPMSRCGLVDREQIEEHVYIWSRERLRQTLWMSGFDSIETGYFEMGCNIWARAYA